MSSWADVHRIALAVSETSGRLSRDLRRWLVKDKAFVWEWYALTGSPSRTSTR